MKKYIAAVLTIIIAGFWFAGCTREASIPGPDKTTNKTVSNTIVGEWVWYQTTGGIAGVKYTPDKTGKTKKIIFRDNGECVKIENGKVDDSIKYYEVKHEKSWLLNDKADFIYFYRTPPPAKPVDELKTIYRLDPEDDNLILMEEAADGFTSAYRRAK